MSEKFNTDDEGREIQEAVSFQEFNINNVEGEIKEAVSTQNYKLFLSTNSSKEKTLIARTTLQELGRLGLRIYRSAMLLKNQEG